MALVQGQPKVLNLKEIIEAFVRHRREVVTRRTLFLLRKARERGRLGAVALGFFRQGLPAPRESGGLPLDARRGSREAAAERTLHKARKTIKQRKTTNFETS